MGEPTTVTAAKKAAALDKAGILEAIKAKFPGSDVFGDDVLAGLVADALSGASDAPADPMMPGADAKKPETPAVPLFTSAEDEAKVKAASATAPAKTDEAVNELNAAKEQIASLTASVKALEARELSGKIINASAADRKPGPQNIPNAPSPGDHVGASIAAYDQRTASAHQAAVAYRDKARTAGQNISYYDAVVAVTRRKTA